uniref:Cadherin domain-containing protein n=1 Tax=Pygocentrus nattereri TaxID=42514 RepID=A0A3B4DYB1_PYGNA
MCRSMFSIEDVLTFIHICMLCWIRMHCHLSAVLNNFPESSEGLRRRKREWMIPPIRTPENDRGPFPKHIVQLQAHAIAADGEDREEPMEIIVEVIDMNDNTPVFTQSPFLGSVPEASFMTVTATDADDPNTDNADIRYSILSQSPQEPVPAMFVINPVTGVIRVNSAGLDREKYPVYTLELAAGDMQGDGRVGNGTAVITVTDRNDHAPQFEKTSHKVGALVVKLPVTDQDDPQSPAWTAKFRIVNDTGGFFNASTGPNKQEGIITTAKVLQ